MNFIELLKETMETLRASKMRTFLTMLGIIIGIASVITMWSIGSGGKNSIIGNLKKLGYGKYSIRVDERSENYKPKYQLDKNMLEMIKKQKNVKLADVNEQQYVRVSKNGTDKFYGVLNPVTDTTYSISNIKILEGRRFLDEELKNNANVVVIDNVSAKNLFGSNKNALGQKIYVYPGTSILPISFTVVGVLKSPIEALMSVFSPGELFCMVALPYHTYNTNFKSSNNLINSIMVETENPDNLTQEMKDMQTLLEKKYKVKDVFKVESASKELDTFDKMLTTLSLFITLAASISLFVGGIGVMNIMLVTVTERTKEIGIRKAIGATDKDIMKQFLYESIILTGLGGALGILIGMLLSTLIGLALGITPSFSIASILISFGISAVIGVIFGVSPARKAAKLNPIDALRSE